MSTCLLHLLGCSSPVVDLGQEKLRERLGKNRSLVDAASDILSSWGQAWNRPLEKPLRAWARFGFALSGTAPWHFVNFADSVWLNAASAFDSDWTSLLVFFIPPCWFALLIGFQPRRCSPTRFFLEGLIFPGLVLLLLQGPLTRLYGE